MMGKPPCCTTGIYFLNSTRFIICIALLLALTTGGAKKFDDYLANKNNNSPFSNFFEAAYKFKRPLNEHITCLYPLASGHVVTSALQMFLAIQNKRTSIPIVWIRMTWVMFSSTILTMISLVWIILLPNLICIEFCTVIPFALCDLVHMCMMCDPDHDDLDDLIPQPGTPKIVIVREDSTGIRRCILLDESEF